MPRFGRSLLAFIACVLLSAPALQGQDFTRRVADYMNAQVEVNHFQGSILVARNGNVLAKGRYGSTNTATLRQETGSDRYPLGSIAKQFIAAAILQLREQGKLQLQDSVCKYIAKCPSGWDEVKILNLLVQADGIREASSFERTKRREPGRSTSELASNLAFTPGARFRYSNAGYEILGTVIERVSGEPYPNYLKNHIFIPLGMRETSYVEAPRKRSASGHTGADALQSITPNDIELANAHSWGKLYSTVDDLYRWDRALASDELLSKGSKDAMFTPYVDGYGFAWDMSIEFERTADSQAGGIALVGSSIRRYPDDDVCVIVLSNSGDADAGRISRDLAAILFRKHYELPVKHSAIDLDPANYGPYAGRYELTPDFVLTVSIEANHLMIQGSGQPKIEIVPESETRFFAKGLDAAVNFVKGPQGKASQLVLQQGGRDIPAPRID